MLQVGDILYSIIDDEKNGLSYDKPYRVIDIRESIPYTGELNSNIGTRTVESDVCISDDNGHRWWFGQVGYSECWTDFFILEKDRNRLLKINVLINGY